MKKQARLLSAPVLGVGLTLSTSFRAVASILSQVIDQAPFPSLAPMLEKVLPVAVGVWVEGAASQEQKTPEESKKFSGDNLPDRPTQPLEGLGSGVIINANKGYALTNNYMIDQAQKISIWLNDRREFDTKLIGSDNQSDIALLQIQNPNKLTQIAIANSDKLRVGSLVVTASNPFGLGQIAISGIISALGRNGLNLEDLENFIQTDASANRSNSDGTLLNLNGELIGINTVIPMPGSDSIGVGFAIPSNMARTLAQQLIDSGEIKRGLLGIRGIEVSADTAKAFSPDAQHGIFASEVLPGFDSAKADVKAGDIITSLNGRPLNSFAELRSRIATAEPGTKVKPGLLRNGKPLEVEVASDTSISPSVSAGMITPALGDATLGGGQLKDGSKGIKIGEVVKRSPAARADLQKDDVIIGVNRDRVNSITEMRKVLAAEPTIVALQVVRDNESLYLLMR